MTTKVHYFLSLGYEAVEIPEPPKEEEDKPKEEEKKEGETSKEGNTDYLLIVHVFFPLHHRAWYHWFIHSRD